MTRETCGPAWRPSFFFFFLTCFKRGTVERPLTKVPSPSSWNCNHNCSLDYIPKLSAASAEVGTLWWVHWLICCIHNICDNKFCSLKGLPIQENSEISYHKYCRCNKLINIPITNIWPQLLQSIIYRQIPDYNPNWNYNYNFRSLVILDTSRYVRYNCGCNCRWEFSSIFSHHNGQSCIISYHKSLADPGVAPFPTGSNSFIFACVFAKKCSCRRSVPPQRVGAPNGKSWIRHCKYRGSVNGVGWWLLQTLHTNPGGI